MANVLIVSRDERFFIPAKALFRRRGYLTEVRTDPPAAYDHIVAHLFDLVLLDIERAGDAAWRLLGMVRAAGPSPKVVAVAGPWDRHGTMCRRQGAADVLRKPVRFDLLPERALRQLGRSSSGRTDLGGIQVDEASLRAWVAGRQIRLTGRELRLLQVMGREPGRVVGRAQLLSQVWGRDDEPGSNLVPVYVNALRRKLGPGVIETVRGAGYRLVAPG